MMTVPSGVGEDQQQQQEESERAHPGGGAWGPAGTRSM